MDILMQAALAYETLTQHKFRITFSNGESIIVRFRKNNFRHLSGLDKCKDLQEIATCYNPSELHSKVCRGEITIYDLQRSNRYFEVLDRITFLPNIKEMLCCGLAVFGFDPSKTTFQSKLKSTILLFFDDSFEFYLTLGLVESTGCYYPETFFNNFGGGYTVDQNIVSIVKTEELL